MVQLVIEKLPRRGVYFPRGETNDDAEILLKIEDISHFTCADRPFVRITGVIMRPENGDVKIHVYASDQVLKGYEPEVGANIEAVVWMQGYLSPGL